MLTNPYKIQTPLTLNLYFKTRVYGGVPHFSYFCIHCGYLLDLRNEVVLTSTYNLYFEPEMKKSCPKRAIIQSKKKWKHQFFRRLRAANSVVLGRIWTNFKLIQALMYVIITCKYEKDPIKNNREKGATPFFKL